MQRPLSRHLMLLIFKSLCSLLAVITGIMPTHQLQQISAKLCWSYYRETQAHSKIGVIHWCGRTSSNPVEIVMKIIADIWHKKLPDAKLLTYCQNTRFKSGLSSTFQQDYRHIHIQDETAVPDQGIAMSFLVKHNLHVSSVGNLSKRQGLSWFAQRCGWILSFLIYSLNFKL